MPGSQSEQIARYLRDHAVDPPERHALPAPSPSLRTCVVIPAYDELERIDSVVDSLRDASDAPETYEVLVVVNNPSDAPESALEANIETIERLERADTEFPLHVVDRASPGSAFPPDDAGVGRARRLAMDLAVDRLSRAGAGESGLVACVDGDAPVGSGYVDKLVRNFDTAPEDLLGGVCRYRHPIPDDDPEHARAIIAYETWMRYFEVGLHSIATPYAYQSIGSCMVLTARGYALADGVPTREALSDFYLLQKVAKVGGFGAVRQFAEPVVYPSARPSERVPRGTGPSVRESMQRTESRFEWVEPPEAFDHLRDWIATFERGYDHPGALRDAPEPLEEILHEWEAWSVVEKLRTTAPDAEHFARHLHQWFDSLKIVKYCNERARRGERVWIFDALRTLLRRYTNPDWADQIPDRSANRCSLRDRRRVLELLRDHELELHTATLE